MTAVDLFFWVIVPYVALTTFIAGHIWRYRHDQFGWTSRSSQLYEKPLLAWGSPLFHYGALAAIAGHVIGILVPEPAFTAIGFPESTYRWFSAIAGTVAGLAVVVGLVILIYRRIARPRLRAATSVLDWIVYAALGIGIGTGIGETMAVNLFGAGYDYRTSIALWYRGLFTAQPHISAVTAAPLIYQVHAIAVWLVIGLFPFTRLVHAWSAPWWYLWRPYLVYRRRRAIPAQAGASGRWRPTPSR